MPPSLKRKVGPLAMYQWIGIGAIVGLGWLVWKRTHPASSGEPEGEVFGGTGTGAFGPIDPETGIPYQFEAGGSAGSGTGITGGLPEFLEILGAVRELFGPSEAATEAGQAQTEATGAGAKTPHKKAKQAKKGHKATSTGGGAAAGGAKHTSAPHPKERIGVSHNHPVSTAHAGVGGNHAVGSTPSHATPGAGPKPAGAGSASGGVIHPQAVSMGISSNQPKPAAPPGWHVYKGANGQWWRAPN